MTTHLRWGILATGAAARTFAGALGESRTGTLAAVASRNEEKAKAFASSFGIGRSYSDYASLLLDAEVDAVYVGSPHSFHAEWTIKAAEAGKHVLCEKPLALNYPQAMAIADAAQASNTAVVEGFMYCLHPQVAAVQALLMDRAIGALQLVEATYSFDAGPRDPKSRLFDLKLGGGGILDVGCYCVHAARLLAGAATGNDRLEPVSIGGAGTVGPTGVDEYAIASLGFPDGIVAQIMTGIAIEGGNLLRLVGSEGEIVVVDPPWSSDRSIGSSSLLLSAEGRTEEISIPSSGRSTYAEEADAVAAAAADPQARFQYLADSLANMRVLDEWRKRVGVTYPDEIVQERFTSRGARLQRRSTAAIPTAHISRVDKPVSRLVMGTDNQPTPAYAAVMFDAFFESGGTTFDTAWIYGNGQQESLLGGWHTARGVRDSIVILGKGAHTPHCHPELVQPQLEESLSRLQTDYVDIYMLHRDNPKYPAGEFIEALNGLLDGGLCRAFGMSNWTLGRISEAEAYARGQGIRGISAISNQFSLAEMLEPTVPGCVSAFGAKWQTWLAKEQMPLMPWSTLAGGFLAREDDSALDEAATRSWVGRDNVRRRKRLHQLAELRGTTPAAVGVAYVLRQPFPTFALVGPRTLGELRTTLGALELTLSDREIAFLEIGGPLPM